MSYPALKCGVNNYLHKCNYLNLFCLMLLFAPAYSSSLPKGRSGGSIFSFLLPRTAMMSFATQISTNLLLPFTYLFQQCR